MPAPLSDTVLLIGIRMGNGKGRAARPEAACEQTVAVHELFFLHAISMDAVPQQSTVTLPSFASLTFSVCI